MERSLGLLSVAIDQQEFPVPWKEWGEIGLDSVRERRFKKDQDYYSFIQQV